MKNTFILHLIFEISMVLCNQIELNNIRKERPSFLSNHISPNSNDYLFADISNCTTDNCPFPNECHSNNKICICQPGFANYPLYVKADKYCQYKQHSQLLSFFLELLLNLGIGHLVAGRIYMGSIKLIVCIVPFFFYRLKGNTSKGCAHLFCGCCHCCIIIIWWMCDAICFGMNLHRDGNGVPMAKW